MFSEGEPSDDVQASKNTRIIVRRNGIFRFTGPGLIFRPRLSRPNSAICKTDLDYTKKWLGSPTAIYLRSE